MEPSTFLSEEVEHSFRSLFELSALRLQLQDLAFRLSSATELQPFERVEGISRFPKRPRRSLEIIGQLTDQAEAEIAVIEDIVWSIGNALDDSWKPLRRSDEVPLGYPNRPKWCLGTVTLRFARRPFLRGYVDLLERRPVAPRLSKRLLALFTSVPGTRDFLDRENHGHWGYHYHYCDKKQRRSDTLLTFDHRLGALPQPTLCWERHAEEGKFSAKAGAWGMAKCESVYGVCYPDTKKWHLTDFKTPGNNALPVWPK